MMERLEIREAIITLVRSEVRQHYEDHIQQLQSQVNRLEKEVNELRSFLQKTFPLADL